MQVMQVMSEKGLGAAIGVDAQRRVTGIFTDGDLRRLLAQGVDVRAMTAAEVMKTQPRSVLPGMLAVEAAQAMEQHRITTMVVMDESGVLQGVLNMHDLMRAKVI
jgi:arabinose-5-phosphate isomerase